MSHAASSGFRKKEAEIVGLLAHVKSDENTWLICSDGSGPLDGGSAVYDAFAGADFLIHPCLFLGSALGAAELPASAQPDIHA